MSAPRETGSAWSGKLDAVRWIGPGLVMAATAIGASHLVLAPTAGALFGFALLWVIPFSHIFKYPAFEFGPRYAVATDQSLLDGYGRVPGPAGWALWVFLAGTVVQGVTVLAGVIGVAAAVVAAVVPGVPLSLLSAALGVAAAGLLWSGGFDGLSALSKYMLGVLAVMTVLAFVAVPPGPSAARGLFVPAVPAGSVVLLAAILGWMPTGIDVSVWHSMWALQRRVEWRERARRQSALSPSDIEGDEASGGRTLGVGLLDLRIGYALSFLLGILFVVLGAQVLRPIGAVPQGAGVAITIARLYTDVLGGWAYPFFLLAAFFGMFSSTYGVLDGFPRAFSETVRRIRSTAVTAPSGRDRLYWGFMLTSLALAVAENVWVRNPVTLVTIAAVASFLLAPILYALNYYCVTRLIPQPSLRPSAPLRLWAVIGIACMAAATLFFMIVQFG